MSDKLLSAERVREWVPEFHDQGAARVLDELHESIDSGAFDATEEEARYLRHRVEEYQATNERLLGEIDELQEAVEDLKEQMSSPTGLLRAAGKACTVLARQKGTEK